MEQMKLRLKKWWGITQRYSIFYICFVSYLFVLLFSVLFNIYNYNAYISELKNQKSLYDQMMFQQFDEMINAELTKVDSLLVNVMMDSDILQVVASNDIIAAGQISQTYEAAASMRSYSGEVTNLYIYFESNDAIIMDGAYYRPEKFYQQFVDHAAYDFEEWHVAQRETYYHQYERSYSADPNEFILYHTISTITGRKALVAIAFSLEDAFSVFQESFFAGQMVFQITSEDGEVLADFGYEGFEEDHGRQTEPYTSTRTGWTFVSAIPSDVYDSTINGLVLRTIIVLIVELALGIGMSFLFARSNTAPVRALYNKLTGQALPLPEKVKNEFRLVDHYFESLLKEKDKLLEQHNQVVKNNVLLAILNNSVTQEEAERDYLRSMEVDLSGPEFQVVSVQIEYGDSIQSQGLESQSLMKYHVMGLIEQSVMVRCRPSFADVSWNQVAVIISGEELRAQTYALCQALEEIKDGFQENAGASLSIGVGGVHRSFQGIGSSYRESLAALEYRILEERGTVSSYQDVGDRELVKAFYPTIDKVRIKARIRSGDGAGAVEMMDQVFESIGAKRTVLPLEMAKCLFFEIMGIGLEVLAEIKFHDEGTQAKYMETLYSCQTIGQLHTALNHILMEICEFIKNGQSDRNQKLLERIDAYIQANCYDNNFSLVSLADHMNLTPTYLSSFFKEKMGENLVDRIARLRMTKAKELLLTTSANVSEIALQVGYASSGTFIRGFKKLEGVTPTQYRREHGEGEK